MNEEILRIQKMVADGKITPEDGAELIETVRTSEPPTQIPVTSVATASRFSRKAIIGAAWAPLFLFAVVLGTMHMPQTGEYHGPAWWQYLLLFTLFPLGVFAPFGTTILGALALSQIRRSAGRLCGLGLALFDVLFFPLLALDVGISLLIYAFGCGFLNWPPFDNKTAEIVFLTCIISVVVDVPIIWLAWRAARKPLKGLIS